MFMGGKDSGGNRKERGKYRIGDVAAKDSAWILLGC